MNKNKLIDPYLTLPIKPDLKNNCTYCNVEFAFYTLIGWKRHHCRNCGNSVCTPHSYLKYPDNRESRICIGIYSLECERKRSDELTKLMNK